jgi:hypothetical protein
VRSHCGLGLARLAAVCCLLAAALAAAPSTLAATGLPSVRSGHRPGPDALYAPPPKVVPQLENDGPWKAAPILVSGAQSYRDGEWLYQDFLFDDHGAAGVPDRDNPYGPGAHLFSPVAGTLTYPTDDVFAHNAADLVELRVRPLAGETAFRVTLNTLKDPERTAFTIALGESPAARAWPHGAGVSSPAELFLTVHGDSAELVDAASGAVVAGGASAAVDRRRRQVDVRVPHSAWDPGRGKVRMTIGVGLWDAPAGRYLAPAGAEATAASPGGAAPSGAALFNVGPRFDEPVPDVDQGGIAYSFGDAAAGSAVQAAWWRERAQADALRLGDASPFHAEVDFGKLAAGARDDSGVPAKGPIDRIFASRHDLGQGLDPERVCFDLASSFSAGAKCEGRFVGQLQPYALYVPRKPTPAKGFGLTLLLHSLSANYNQYTDSKNQSQLGDRGAGTLVATPAGRGPDGFYAGIPEADTFEVWADVARHYRVDADWAVVSGYSMGGFGTYRLLARWPDLFARGAATVGIPGSANDQLPSLRNTPLMTWNAVADELVQVDDAQAAGDALASTGLRFTFDLFETADHLTLATNDEFGPVAEFLGEHRVDRDPAHVTYVVDAKDDSKAARAVADHAYWVSGLGLRDQAASPLGTIDVRSRGFGVGDSAPTGERSSEGQLQGGSHGPMPYHRREQAWGDPPAEPRAKALTVRASKLGTATLDAGRARVGCAPRLAVESDGPLELRLTCPVKRPVACARSMSVVLPRVQGRRLVDVAVMRGGKELRRVRAASLRKVRFRRPSRKAFTLELRGVAEGGTPLTVTVQRRYSACG